MKVLQRRLYQVRAANKAMTSRKKRVLIVSPGASGKTVIAALLVSKARRSDKRVLVQ